ncbi:MAG TPA: histidine--tRNA ligase [Acidimicrobiales bacterium]|nr:histidine--tRNA ligase [Acidimicrobiales bacterium]
MPAQHQAPKGTLDVLPPGNGGAPFDSAAFSGLVGKFAARVAAAGFGLIVGPMFEDLAVYARVGATTDIVRKEMYDFHDKGDRHLALRPDSTPSVVRAYVEHRPTLPWKVWYATAHFRYDQPQAGRYRQHHSVGVEVLGVADADLDAELIALSHQFLTEDVALGHVELMINSIGDDVCRPAYRDELVHYVGAHEVDLCAEHRDHWRDNPMRLFDCKREPCRAVTDEAPRLLDHLCEPCAAHFERTKAGLEALKIDYRVETRLIRGQDYYNRTTFEYESTALTNAQLALGGGGRYDGFVEALGGPATPGIGFGLGIERILLAAQAEAGDADAQTRPSAGTSIDVFVIDTTPDAVHAAALTNELRQAGVRTDRAYDQRSYKAQMKQAIRSGASHALVVEPEGWTIRTLQEKGEPTPVEPADAVPEIRKRMPTS